MGKNLFYSIFNAIYEIKDNLSRKEIFHFIFRFYYSILALFYYFKKDYYLCLKSCCRVKRIIPDISKRSIINKLYEKLFFNYILKKGEFESIENNFILRQFMSSLECKKLREKFLKYDLKHITSLKYPKNNDYPERQGNLLIFKKYDPHTNEKGVLYLKYNESFKQFITLFELEKISKHYRIVLEPSTWGYMDEVFHLFIGKDSDIIVQAQDENDYMTIKNMNVNLIPIRLGSGDWVDADLFNNVTEEIKIYDIVMIASWLKIKRHKTLFKAVAKSKLKNIKIALIGYPWGFRTRKDIEKEAKRFNILNQIDFYENIPSQKVAEIIKKSKVSVMLSKREGANRAIYECLLCGTPVVLCKFNRGVNKNIINSETGCLADDDELGEVLSSMIKNYAKYNTASWARKNIGREVAHKKLNDLLKDLAVNKKEEYLSDICKIKASNAPYVYDRDRIDMSSEYLKLEQYLRGAL